MWGFLLSYIEELLVSPYRPPPGRSGAVGLIGWGIVVLTLTGFVLRMPAFALIPVFFSIYVLASIGAAYRCLERARDLPLDDPREPPSPHRTLAFVFPTAAALFSLARALDATRRGKPREADELSRVIDRDRLRSQENRLLEGVGALVMLERGNASRAAERALAALPTGCDDIDARLGRLALKSAWGSDQRLGKIDDAWNEAGVPREGEGSLPRLRRLVELRLINSGQTLEELAGLPAPERRALADEARAVGDEALARDLEEGLSPPKHGYR